MTGLVSNIQKYTIHDGPGIRTEIFFKGCNYNCPWCSNPEAISPKKELGVYPSKCVGCGMCVKSCPESGVPITFENGIIAAIRQGASCDKCLKCADVCPGRAIKVWGDEYTVSELMEIIEKDRSFYERSGGGVTVSGGEVMLQWEFVLELLSACKKAGIHTCVESALKVDEDKLLKVLEFTDMVISDIKHMDPERHKAMVGSTNELTLSNIRKISGMGIPFIIRTPVIPGFNDTQSDIEAIGEFIESLPAKPIQYQLLPYRKMGTEKLESLGKPYPLGDDFKVPEREEWEPKLLALEKTMNEHFSFKTTAGYNQKY